MLCLALLLLFGFCGKIFPSGQNPIYKETLTVDVFDSLANYQGLQSGWFAKIVRDKFNIQLNIIAPNVSGGGDTLYQTRKAAGNLGDIIICHGNTLKDLVTAGLIMDISPYLKDKEIMQYESAIRHLNDSISRTAVYAIPSEISLKSCMTPSEGQELTYGPYLRYDLYTAVGSPRMETLTDLLPVLKQMQEAYPVSESGNKTYGFSFFRDWDGNMMNAAKQPACFYGYEEYGFVLYKADGSEYQDILDSSSIYQQILKFYFDANQMGLVDPDSPNQNYSDVYEKCTQGDLLYSCWPFLGKSAYNTAARTQAGKGFMLVPIEDLKILSNGCHPMGTSSAVIAVGSNAKDPERLVAFIDWLYSPEGIYAGSAQPVSGTAGPQGLTWEMTDEGPALTDFGIQALSDTATEVPEEWGGGTWASGSSALNFNGVALISDDPSGYPYYYTLWDSYQASDNTALAAAWKADMQAETSLEYLLSHDQVMVCPGIFYQAPPESYETATLRAQCRNVIVDYSWKMIFAPDEASFYDLQEKMQVSAESLGYKQVLAEDMTNAKKQMQIRQEAVSAEQGEAHENN